ncbi:RidA family protein [Streptomyces sp. NPDC086554]|uniref:RidA family protein n=1 Tax=Streptomyces sp. NPDC086554 TaxID=3154864 RepID=UPI00343A1D23
MSRLTHISAPDGVSPATQYTHVVMGTGRFVAISGQLPLDKEGNLVGDGDPAAQARQVFDNLWHCLVAAGGSFRDVVKLTYFVTDMAYMPAIRTARDTYLDPARLPAASAVQVSALVSPQCLMEIEAYAVL